MKYKMTVRNYEPNKDLVSDNSEFPYLVTLHIPLKNGLEHVEIGKSHDFPHRRIFNTYYFQSDADRTMFILKWS